MNTSVTTPKTLPPPKTDLSPRERVIAHRRRTRRPMATAKVVLREGGFFRLSNGTLQRGKPMTP